MEKDIVRAALRTAKECDATDKEWEESSSASGTEQSRGLEHEAAIYPASYAGGNRTPYPAATWILLPERAAAGGSVGASD
jgi:hypothetical protein